MHAQAAQVAAASYEDSTMTSAAALLTSGDPQAVLRQASLLLELAGTRTAKVKLFLAAASQVTASLQQERRTRDALTALEDQKEQQKQHAAHLLASKEATLASLTAPEQQAVAAGGVGAGGTTTAVYTGPTSTRAEKAVAFAYAQLGKPYRRGATGPGSYDCSGLVQAAWASAGVSIPATPISSGPPCRTSPPPPLSPATCCSTTPKATSPCMPGTARSSTPRRPAWTCSGSP
jgi:peptidoglycan DL-endopeptidase CwlO